MKPSWTMEPKFLYDWTMDKNADVATLAWCDEDGVHRAELPAWLIERLFDKHDKQKDGT